MQYDVYCATGVCVEIPDGVDPDSPEGVELLKRVSTQKFVDAILEGSFDITFEPYEE
jgi:hypothetical protein